MFLSLSKLIDFSKTKETENIKVDYILYFTRDKSKKLIIDLQPDDDLITIEQNYIGEYENFIPNFGHSINQYKYILLDTRNKYNEFILNNNFKPYLYLKKGYYELYYLKIIVKTELISESTINQYYKAQSKSFDFIRNDYYFFNPKNKKQIKTDEIYKYTKKRKKYEKINFTLFNDSIQIIKQNKHEFIPIYYIISINSSDFDEKYRLLTIMIGFPEKIKEYRIAIPKKTFNIWESLIYNQFISIKGIYEFNMYKEEISSLIKKKNGLFVQIIDKNDNFKEIMMIDEKIRNYLFEKITNENVKKLIQLIINYKLNFNSKEYKECYNNLNEIINLLSCDKELNEKKEDLDNLIIISKKYATSENENNDSDKLLSDILNPNILDPIYLFCYNHYIINFINELNDIKSNNFNNIFFYLESKNDLINFEEKILEK
jgi:hypothetical protein